MLWTSSSQFRPSFFVTSRDSLVEQDIVLWNLLSILLSGFALCTMFKESLEDN
jgi:hypothetical protein